MNLDVDEIKGLESFVEFYEKRTSFLKPRCDTTGLPPLTEHPFLFFISDLARFLLITISWLTPAAFIQSVWYNHPMELSSHDVGMEDFTLPRSW